jgi:hypothetical protein
MSTFMYGPLNTGAAAGGAGVATANSTSTVVLRGRVLAAYVKYNHSPPAGTTDVTIATLGTSPSPPANTILTITDAATDGWFYPRHTVHDEAAAAITYDGTREVHEAPPILDKVKVTIAQANAADNVDVWLLLG